MLDVCNLQKSFGALKVTRDVFFKVPPGGRYGIIGPNGSGKTTLFNLLTGELRADGGSVRLDGQDILNLSPDARARLGLTRSFQKNNLFNEATVFENIAIAVTIKRGAGRDILRRFDRLPGLDAEVMAIAARMGLDDALKTSAGRLPYGTQRQLELALALALAPKVLLLDEPTAGMGPDETIVMTTLIANLPRSTTIVIVEHDMSVLFGVAERLIVLDYGRVLIEGTPAEVRGSELVKERYFGGLQ